MVVKFECFFGIIGFWRVKDWFMRSYLFIGLISLFLVVSVGFSQDKVDSDLRAKCVELAATDHISLLKLAIGNYDENIRDYTGTFHKQERIRDKMGKKQVISFKFMEKPFSVAMNWEENAGSANRLLFVEGKNDNLMLVHPTGIMSWVKSAKVDPRGKTALSNNLRPCDVFGFRRNMVEALKIYVKSYENGDLESKSLGIEVVDGREYLTLERVLPDTAGMDYPAAKLLMRFDLEYLLPVGMKSFGWDGKLISDYGFEDLKFNIGLENSDFSPKTNNL